MPKQPLFAGLVIDENGSPAGTTYVGDEPCYVLDDAGFRRHVSSEQVDRQVLQHMQDLMKGSEDLISEQTAKMLGQEDIFSIAMIANQLRQMDKQFDALFETGIPDDARAYLVMMGFKIHINIHGEVLDIEQPGAIEPDSGE